MTVDPRAINYVLNHPVEYEKPPITLRLLSSLIGSGTIMFSMIAPLSIKRLWCRFTRF